MSPGQLTSRSDADALTEAIEALGAGDRKGLFDLLADDVRCSWMGVKDWSRTFVGKSEVIGALFGGVDKTIAGQQGVELLAVVADGLRVVVGIQRVYTTAAGDRYDNRYWWVATFDAGRLTELHEYMDTQLVADTFGSGTASQV
jgi:ketosteroid isomerase-like protein